MNASFLALQSEGDLGALAGLAAMGMMWMVFWTAFLVLVIVSMWKLFEKAGKPGWAAIVPIYNVVVLLQIAGKPEWWVILYFIPLVNIVMSILVCIALARRFGRGDAFGVGLFFLGPIFFPILAFGDSRYQPAAAV